MVKVAILALDDTCGKRVRELVKAAGSVRIVAEVTFLDVPRIAEITASLRGNVPDILFVDIPPENLAVALQAMEAVQQTLSGTAIVALGNTADPSAIIAAMRTGACEFLDRGCSPEALPHLLDQLGRRRGKSGKLITVVGAKGGCGATTVAVNLAVCLQQRHGKTALVDLALLGHAAVHLNAKPRFQMEDAFGNSQRMDASILAALMTPCDCGVHLLAGTEVPMAFAPDEEKIWEVLDTLLKTYAYVVVDASFRLEPAIRTICDLSDTILLVCETDVVALLWGAPRVSSFLSGPGIVNPRIRLVLNRFHHSSGFSDEDAEAASDARIIGKIPSDGFAIGRSLERGIPVALQKHSEIGDAFLNLASAVARPGSDRTASRLIAERRIPRSPTHLHW